MRDDNADVSSSDGFQFNALSGEKEEKEVVAAMNGVRARVARF